MKMSDDELLAEIAYRAVRVTDGSGQEIAYRQARALDNYLRRPIGNEEEGRSQVVSSDIFDTVEGILPNILKPFITSDRVVQFEPLGPHDTEKAEQETDYVNYIVTARNNAFLNLYTAAKAGLIYINAHVKYWWETSRRVKLEKYEGLDQMMFAMISDDPNIEVLKQTERVTNDVAEDGTITQSVLYDVELRIVNPIGCARFETLPPEEILIGSDAKSIDPRSSRYVEHRTTRTRASLREEGYDIEDEDQPYSPFGEDLSPAHSPQFESRHRDEVGAAFREPDRDEVEFREIYMRIDADGDGMEELRRICLVGRTILANEEIEEVPIIAWSPCLMPFRHFGLGIDDIVGDIHTIKTTLKRQLLDNIYTANNNRTYVSEFVDIDDIISNPLGGVVRINTAQSQVQDVRGHTAPVEITPLGPVILPAIEMMDGDKENRTGYTRYNSGLDANSLNKTATGVQALMSAANMRMELIARIFGECLVKPLMIGIHGLCRRHATKAETVRLRGNWVPVDPRNWAERMDMTVSVGLGTGNEQQRQVAAQELVKSQADLMPTGITNPQTLSRAYARFVEALGYKDVDNYMVNVQQQPPQPQADPRAEIEKQKIAAQQQIEQQRMQAEMEKHNASLDLEHTKHLDSMALETFKLKADLAKSADGRAIDAENAERTSKSLLDKEDRAHQRTLEIMDIKGQGKPSRANREELASIVQGFDAMAQSFGAMAESINALVKQMSAPKRVIRDAGGQVVGIESKSDIESETGVDTD